jgi:hypothetical protein
MIGQPETRPISQEQLVAEVKGIYAGLVMVESKCIEVDNSQSAEDKSSVKLNNEQWQALIALHRTLLHEHHDFFLASQHPSASPALRRLASKQWDAMPERIWPHGIHSFREIFRHRLPTSLEDMLTFIYLAYAMMDLPYETAPRIECLGDLGRYRIALENEGIRDPAIERLHHHSVPEDWSLRGLLLVDELYSHNWLNSETLDGDKRDFDGPPLLSNILRRVSWRMACPPSHLEAPSHFPEALGRISSGLGSSPSPFRLPGPTWLGGHFKSQEFCSDPFDNLQRTGNISCLAMPKYLLSPISLLSVVPQKLLWLAILTAMATPVVSAELPGRDVVTVAWAFGIMANIPSVYVLANPPVPLRVDDGAEKILWKVARGW